MRRLVLVVGILALSFMSFSPVSSGGGDNACTVYFPQQIGAELTYENYNAKDKLESTDRFKVVNFTENGDSTLIDVEAASFDKKGEEIYNGTFSYTCKDGVFRISMESILDPAMMEAYKDMEVTMTQSDITFPSDLNVGTSLPDAEMNVKVASNGMQVMEMNFKITDRKVEAKEAITTPAGKFDCFKLTQTTNMKMMFMNKSFTSVDWISANVGNVRSETYDNKGSLESYRILTNIK